MNPIASRVRANAWRVGLLALWLGACVASADHFRYPFRSDGAEAWLKLAGVYAAAGCATALWLGQRSEGATSLLGLVALTGLGASLMHGTRGTDRVYQFNAFAAVVGLCPIAAHLAAQQARGRGSRLLAAALAAPVFYALAHLGMILLDDESLVSQMAAAGPFDPDPAQGLALRLRAFWKVHGTMTAWHLSLTLVGAAAAPAPSPEAGGAPR